ncbi:trans-sialidase, putative [Trypanosoma cruzi]|uniref:Trans-sialidase, putative n=1 Tax=Trypanosoma cruzi (strain CL Brener) TaxID=353153 RepID=Q4D649_TRYCC|nr:trans-sialidase, putative [Trypanosoma cruzi]EAN87995.1 trans-sialidase, putative [Trypanosoma cruzi]|eukprot:XP_809846.1 trans-sialidase [Trypanosoma cruzi strain CL Brener]
MLSRVAAVKAPRTHNRRRVTGSRGRRREGGESEPQRPNMSRRLFTSAVLLLPVVMMCCGSGAAHVVVEEQSVADPNFEWKGIPKDVTVESLGVPGLLKVGSDVFAVAEAQCKKSGENNVFTGIASQIITTQTANTPVEVLKDSKDKTQFLEDGSEDPRKKVDVSRPTTVMKRNDIYMLVGKYSRTAAGEKSGANDGGLLLVKGEVIDESDGGKRIKWKDNDDVSRASVGELESWTGMTGGGGSGVKMEDGTLLFPVEGAKKKGEAQNDEKAVSLIIHSLKDTKSWKLSNWMSDGGCSDPSVVEWKDKLMMMTACDDGRRRVYESADKGDSWTEALGTLSRVWGNKKGVRSGFITATIDGVEDNRNVMLVTLPVYANKADKEVNVKGRLHLWLTDNTHIVDIGPVSGDAVAASSLLYKSSKSGNEKEELIALYEKKDEGDTPSLGMVSVRLTEQLQRVKDVLATWKEVDERVSQLCATLLAQKDPSADTACGADKITDGLVGFLSGSFSYNTWRDEYLGVDATVKGGAAKAAKTSDGVTFRGAWAEWPVGEQGENQLYHFANYNFTLVATVSIDKVPEEGDTPIPVMGVKRMKGDKSTVLLGLSYNNREKKLELLSSGGKASELSSNWEPGKTHQVAIVLRNGNQGFVYVDGRRVEGAPLDLKDKCSKGISHFYIGGDGDSAGSREGVSVTVTNVLLYNRPLSDIELTVLNTIKLSIPQTAEEGETDEGTALDGGAHGDASNHCGSELLPSLLLLLLGLWWFAAL